jgi:hypothetical protein
MAVPVRKVTKAARSQLGSKEGDLPEDGIKV